MAEKCKKIVFSQNSQEFLQEFGEDQIPRNSQKRIPNGPRPTCRI